MKINLKLKNPDQVKKLIDTTSPYSEDLSEVHDRYVIDAKSVLGIFSMDLSKPIDPVSDTENDYLVSDMRKMVAPPWVLW